MRSRSYLDYFRRRAHRGLHFRFEEMVWLVYRGMLLVQMFCLYKLQLDMLMRSLGLRYFCNYDSLNYFHGIINFAMCICSHRVPLARLSSLWRQLRVCMHSVPKDTSFCSIHYFVLFEIAVWSIRCAGGVSKFSVDQSGSVSMSGNLNVSGTIGVNGAATLASLSVTNASTLNTLTVNGAATINNTLRVTGAVTFTSSLSTGAVTINSGGLTASSQTISAHTFSGTTFSGDSFSGSFSGSGSFSSGSFSGDHYGSFDGNGWISCW